MAIIKMQERRASVKITLLYAYRGDDHEHDVTKISHIGGNVFSRNPVKYNADGSLSGVDVDALVQEFEEHNSSYTGMAQNLYKHLSISIAQGEHLTDFQWFEAANETMRALGFDESSKWVAVRHSDKEHEHIHIIYSLVSDDGQLIDQHNDAHKGFEVMRKIELKYGLKMLENPEDSLNVDAKKEQIKAAGGMDNISKDWGRIIRARINEMVTRNGGQFPHSMSAFAVELSKVGVEIKVSTDKEGRAKGISYRASNSEDCPWISGSKLKGTVYSFNALQKRGVSYLPGRDDVLLRIKEAPDKFAFGIVIKGMGFSIRTNLKMVKTIKKMKNRKEKLIENMDREPFIDLTFAHHLGDKRLLIAFLKVVEALRVLFGDLTEDDEKYIQILMLEDAYREAMRRNALIDAAEQADFENSMNEIKKIGNDYQYSYEFAY
ncbi:relaxase/mobilization nuclease domain-containing protein [Shewanella sp. A25]|nr:relaxase/mobilization nuclease domain-containing protein [Shewanella shenzhenensis]